MGRVTPICLRFGIALRDPNHPTVGMARGSSLARPLGLVHGGRRRAETRFAPVPLPELARCNGAVHVRLLPPFISPFYFIFILLFSAVSENKDIQNRRIVQLHQVRLWLWGAQGFHPRYAASSCSGFGIQAL